MRKSIKIIQAVSIVGIGVAVGVLITSLDTRYDFLASETAVTKEIQEDRETYPPYVTTQSEATQEAREPSEVKLTKEESHLLAKIIMAEAESEPITGQALVGRVVLNRVESPEFPDTIEEVIFQEGQFCPVASGRFDAVEPDDSCKAAVHLITTGWDESQGATYFEADNDSTWHEDNLQFLFKEGGHYFYK